MTHWSILSRPCVITPAISDSTPRSTKIHSPCFKCSGHHALFPGEWRRANLTAQSGSSPRLTTLLAANCQSLISPERRPRGRARHSDLTYWRLNKKMSRLQEIMIDLMLKRCELISRFIWNLNHREFVKTLSRHFIKKLMIFPCKIADLLFGKNYIKIILFCNVIIKYETIIKLSFNWKV